MDIAAYDTSSRPVAAQVSVSIPASFPHQQEAPCYIHKPSETLVCGPADLLLRTLDCSDPGAALVPVSERDETSVYATIYCPRPDCGGGAGGRGQQRGHDRVRAHLQNHHDAEGAKSGPTVWLTSKLPVTLQELFLPSSSPSPLSSSASPESPAVPVVPATPERPREDAGRRGRDRGRGRGRGRGQKHHVKKSDLGARKSRPKGTGTGTTTNAAAPAAGRKAMGALAMSIAVGWILVTAL